MAGPLTRHAYQNLIDEDLDVLRKTMPRSLERDHIELVLEHSVASLYGCREGARLVRSKDDQGTEVLDIHE